jgi:hypothetical protein
MREYRGGLTTESSRNYGEPFDDPDAWRTSRRESDVFNKFITTADERLQTMAGAASNLDVAPRIAAASDAK